MTTADHNIGDGPVQAEYLETMKAIVRLLDESFNGNLRGKDRTTGFVLLVFPFNSHDGRCNYMSNGADRKDIVTMFREQIARFEGVAGSNRQSIGVSMNDETIEQEIQRKGLTAPRVTPERLEAVIKSEEYHVFGGTTLTVCCPHLQNGFTVTGESACASPENFNAELGQRIARENAKQKIWALEGYALRERLHQPQKVA